MEKDFEVKKIVLDLTSNWMVSEIVAGLQVLETIENPTVSEQGKTLAFLFDLLEGDYLLKWFDTATMQVLVTKVETGKEEFRWVFGPFQSFIAKLFFLYGEKEVRDMFRGILGARQLAPLVHDDRASTIGFHPTVVNMMQVQMGATAAFFDMNPWAEALLACIAVIQTDVEFIRMKPKVALLVKKMAE